MKSAQNNIYTHTGWTKILCTITVHLFVSQVNVFAGSKIAGKVNEAISRPQINEINILKSLQDFKPQQGELDQNGSVGKITVLTNQDLSPETLIEHMKKNLGSDALVTMQKTNYSSIISVAPANPKTYDLGQIFLFSFIHNGHGKLVYLSSAKDLLPSTGEATLPNWIEDNKKIYTALQTTKISFGGRTNKTTLFTIRKNLLDAKKEIQSQILDHGFNSIVSGKDKESITGQGRNNSEDDLFTRGSDTLFTQITQLNDETSLVTAIESKEVSK